MKINIFAALILVAAICGCSKDNAGQDPEYQFTERKWIELTKSQQEIVSKGNGFAFNLFAALNKAEGDKEVFISPFSMEAALCMLSNGAKGDTYSQIVNAMGYKGLSKEEVNSTYGLLTTALLNADNSVPIGQRVCEGIPIIEGYGEGMSQPRHGFRDTDDSFSVRHVKIKRFDIRVSEGHRVGVCQYIRACLFDGCNAVPFGDAEIEYRIEQRAYVLYGSI